MTDKKRTKRKAAKKKNKNLIGVLCAIFLTVLFFVMVGAMYVRAEILFETRQQLEQCQKEQKKVVDKNRELVNKIAYHDSDKYIEKIAREQLGLVKPNEIVFVDENK